LQRSSAGGPEEAAASDWRYQSRGYNNEQSSLGMVKIRNLTQRHRGTEAQRGTEEGTEGSEGSKERGGQGTMGGRALARCATYSHSAGNLTQRHRGTEG
jgi:hypothetical protein